MNYKVTWSKDSKTTSRQESLPLYDLNAARALAETKKAGNRTVTILKEGLPPNEGKYFLDLIIK